MKAKRMMGIPWLEQRREFFTAQPPKFQDHDYREPPYTSLHFRSDGEVWVGRRLGYTSIMSKKHGADSIVVTDEVWFRFLNGLREGQFDGIPMLEFEVQMTLQGGEIAIRMRAGPCPKEGGILAFSGEAWKHFLEQAKETGTFYDE